MELKDFLLMVFDRQYDRYPIIRKSFLQCWEANEVLDILAITNYHCSRQELKQYIEYSCYDNGIQIVSAMYPLRYASIDKLCNKVVYTDLSNTVVQESKRWIAMILSNQYVQNSILNIHTSTSEYRMILSMNFELVGDPEPIPVIHFETVLMKRRSTSSPVVHHYRIFIEENDTLSENIYAKIRVFCRLFDLSPERLDVTYQQNNADEDQRISSRLRIV